MSQSLFGRVLRPVFGVLFAAALFLGSQIEAAQAQCDAGNGGSIGDLLATNPPPPNDIKNSTNPSDTDSNQTALENLSGRQSGSVNFVERINVGEDASGCIEGVSVDISVDQDGNGGNWQSDQPICFVVVKAGNANGNSGGGVTIYEYDAPDGVGVTSGSWTTSTLDNKRLSHIDFYRCDAQPTQDQGTIQFKKTTKDKDGNQLQSTADNFGFEIDTVLVTSLNTANANPATSSAFPRAAGNGEDYTVAEVQNADWDFVSAKCTSNLSRDETFNSLSFTISDLQANEAVVCEFINKAKDRTTPDKGSIQVEKISQFGDGTFEFPVTGPNNVDENLLVTTSSGIGVSSVISDLDTGDYVVSEINLDPDWTLVSSACRGLNNRTISPDNIDLKQGENVVCTFTNKKETDDPGEDVTKVFINRRVDNLLSHGPDRARILRRLDEQPTGSLKDGGSYEPLKVAGSVKDGNTDVEFSTSLSQIRAAAASAASKKIADAGLSFNESYSGYTPYALSQRLDLWVEGQVSSYDDATGGIERHGHFSILYVGMDYALAPGVLIGGLVQFDRTKEIVDDPDITGSVEGTGWMAGPYLGVKLRDDLFFDARAAWGKSSNDINLEDAVAGPRSGSFDTDRWLATASLTGNYLYGGLRVSPQVSLEYGNEVSDSYFMSNAQKVNSVDATIGRLTFGPEFGYKYHHENGTTVEPHMSVKGIWTFDGDELELSTGTVELDQFRASVEGGVIVRSWDGYAFRAAGSYDGIGSDDLEAWTAKLWLNIPLN